MILRRLESFLFWIVDLLLFLQVGSIREYLDAFESSQAATKERLTMVEVKVAAEGERAAQATLQARDMRAELDGMASNAKVGC